MKLMVLLVAALAACGKSKNDKPATQQDATPAGDAHVIAGPDSSIGGPTILELSTNVTTLTASEQLVVTAVVTDPAGIQQLIGGDLADPSGGTYGAFQVSTTAGAYSLTLTWGAIQTVRDITTGSGGAPRTFKATFYDQSGGSTSKTFTIQLACETATQGICGGTCKDLQSDYMNCGTCGTSCTAVFNGSTCGQGTCSQLISGTTRESCHAACAASGLACSCSPYHNCKADYVGELLYINDCATAPAAEDVTGIGTYPFTSETCECR